MFDIAEEIDLSIVESTFHDEKGTARVSITRTGRNALVMRDAPVRLHLGKHSLTLLDREFQVDLLATVWDYGVLSIVIQIPITPGMAWKELIKKGARLNGDTLDNECLNQFAIKKSKEVAELLKGAIKRPSEWKVFEDYVIYFLEDIQGLNRTYDLIEFGKVPELILSEPDERLSSKARDGINEQTFQYAENDMVTIDWNSAVVVEPSGQRDIPDVLEFALTYLLEFRYYDDLLDKRLSSLYDSIEAGRHGLWKSNYAQLSREANTRFMEFSEFIERIDNSLKVVGDFYLSVIYRAAIRRFRIPDWEQSITKKMNLLLRVSQILQGEVNVHRGHLLEIIIIVLILFEILSAIFKGA